MFIDCTKLEKILKADYKTWGVKFGLTEKGMYILNVGQNLTIDTDRMIAYRSDGTLNNTQVTGNYEDMYLLNGENEISFSGGELKVIPNWRCL